MGIINKLKHLNYNFRIWAAIRRVDCSTYDNKKDYYYKVDVVGEIVATESNGWVRYGCKNAGLWCKENKIYQFDIMEHYLNMNDYKLHFVFGFVHAEDAVAFKLGCDHVY